MTKESESALVSVTQSYNDQLKETVSKSLERSSHHGLRRVRVKVEDDRIVLCGTVASYYLKQMAQETTRQACPMRKVYNELDVIESSSRGGQT